MKTVMNTFCYNNLLPITCGTKRHWEDEYVVIANSRGRSSGLMKENSALDQGTWVQLQVLSPPSDLDRDSASSM